MIKTFSGECVKNYTVICSTVGNYKEFESLFLTKYSSYFLLTCLKTKGSALKKKILKISTKQSFFMFSL